MMFMNTWEIEDAARQYSRHPILGPATRTLVQVRDSADHNSDGWAYWPKPARAAAKLMQLIQAGPAQATVAQLVAANASLKAFRTREGISFDIYAYQLPDRE